jgi:O-antigen/teichoic acid export membrane protein
MSSRRTVARNVIWNWAGTGAQMLAGLLLLPYLVHHLGQTGYGLWNLIASLTGYFDLFDLGIRGSLGRNIAFHRAKNNPDGVKAVVSTGFAFLGLGSVLVLLGTAAVLPLFFRLFDVPPEQAGDVRIALVLIGVNLAVIFPCSVFDSTLWAHERFDLLNLVDIPVTVLRVVLTLLLVGGGHGLVALGGITLGLTVAAGLAKGFCSLRIEPNLRFDLGHVSAEATRDLFGYGVWCFVLAVSRLVGSKLGGPIIGSCLAVPLVTPFAVASRLIDCVNALLVASTGVLTPLATVLHAEDRLPAQRRLFVEGGKWCGTFALFFLGLFAVLGEPILKAWLRRDLEYCAQMLIVLSLGELLPLSQAMTFSMILGIGRHRLFALLGVAEIVVSVVLAMLLIRPLGRLGVCLSIAVPAAVCRGLARILYACRLLNVSPGRYLVQACLPAVGAAVLPVGLLAVLTQWREPAGWFDLFAYVALYSVCYVATGGLAVLGVERVKLIFGRLFRGLPELQASVSECQE